MYDPAIRVQWRASAPSASTSSSRWTNSLHNLKCLELAMEMLMFHSDRSSRTLDTRSKAKGHSCMKVLSRNA